MATLVHNTLCCTMSGLSKVYRACGYRVGWAAFSGDIESAGDYLRGLELLTSLRLCSNVAGQWAVQTALGGHQSIRELTRPGGRLYESRRAIIDGSRARAALTWPITLTFHDRAQLSALAEAALSKSGSRSRMPALEQ